MKNSILLVTSSLHATVSSGQKVDQRWSLARVTSRIGIHLDCNCTDVWHRCAHITEEEKGVWHACC